MLHRMGLVTIRKFMNLQKKKKTLVVCALTLWLVIFQPFISEAEKVPNDPNEANETIDSMTLQDFIKRVVKKNEGILTQLLDFKISAEAVRGEKSVFEPKFLATYQRGRQKNKDYPNTLLNEELNERNEGYNASIQSKVPTGATVKLGYDVKASREFILNIGEQYTSFIGVEISQPLLKGAGMAATANIDVAGADSDIAFQSYRKKMLQTVLNAAAACWDYYGAREKLEIQKDSVKIAEQILKENKERAKVGKMAETEVLVAEAGLIKRESLESMARQNLLTAMDTLRSYISSTSFEVRIDIEFSHEFTIASDFKPDFGSSIRKAFHYRPEYLSARRKIERENIVVSYAKNQRWPQLDLKGSYGLNGLGDSAGDSWNDMHDEDYRTWTVGAELTIPLLGGMKTKSELNSAIYRKKQALLELKSIEVEVANMIDTAIQNVYSTQNQLQRYIKVKGLNQQLLDVEIAMIDAGKSNSRLVLEKEEDLIDARDAALKSLIENKKAILVLEMAEGILLSKYGVEVAPLVNMQQIDIFHNKLGIDMEINADFSPCDTDWLNRP